MIDNFIAFLLFGGVILLGLFLYVWKKDLEYEARFNNELEIWPKSKSKSKKGN